MPDITLVSIMAMAAADFAVAMWVSKVTSERYDELLCGVAKGVPMSLTHRWMMTLTNWLPWAVFLVGWLLMMMTGFLELANSSQDAAIRAFGYMAAWLHAAGAAFWFILGAALTLALIRALRETDRT